MPILAETGIRLFFNGPEAFTPDDRYLLGESPEVAGLFMACGFNSIGIQSSGGAGKVLADWIIDGHPPMDLWDVDVRRVMPFQRNRRYLHDRTVESLGLLYAMHWPFRPARDGARRAAIGGARSARRARRVLRRGRRVGAGQLVRARRRRPGVRVQLRATELVRPYSAAEHHAVRNAVGLFDQSSFGKFLVEGPDAEARAQPDLRQRRRRRPWAGSSTPNGSTSAAASKPTSPSRREADDRYPRRHGGGHTDPRLRLADGDHIGPDDRARRRRRHLGDRGAQRAWGRTRERVAAVAHAGRPVERRVPVRHVADHRPRLRPGARPAASRTSASWVGSCTSPPSSLPACSTSIVDAGEGHGLRLCGYHALNSLRMEKGYRHWGHDISPDETPLEAGLGFVVAWDKPGGFIGREALLRPRSEPGCAKRLAQFRLHDRRPAAVPQRADLARWCHRRADHVRHVRPHRRRVTGHGLRQRTRRRLGDARVGAAGTYEIEVAGERIGATVSLEPFYDPKSARVRA